MLQLRPAHFSDHASIALLHAESWRRTYRGIYSDQFLNEEVEKDRLAVWHGRLNAPADNHETVVAVQENVIVGFACIFLDDDPTHGTLLDNLHVSSHCRKAGIGRLLMQNCARSVLAKGSIPKLYLWVFEMNQNARQFYERVGGANVETILKRNEDGTEAEICRYVWPKVTELLDTASNRRQ
jgi:ribosomal protein S18 acetylase RimI-like enzyme